MGSLGVYSDIAEMPYDPTTGVAKWVDEDDDTISYTATFTETGGTISVHLVTDWDGEVWLDFYGEK